MCGIFCSIGFLADPKHIDAVAHRGPDGRGWRVFESPAGPVALGHRRLAIIDLDDRALQPMASSDGRYWLVFNGEIYNYLELREELRPKGAVFRTESDAEVLLTAYQVWGADSLDRLVGMFSFVIWDDAAKVLFAARDRLGVKPLIYHSSSKGLAIGSEIKQMLDLPSFSRRIELNRAHNFLETGVTDHLAGTMFVDASNIGPGRYLRLDLNSWSVGDPLPVRTYWNPPLPDDRQWSEEDAAERFRELFFDSIRLHMRADVRVGSCLSGGLDSSSIVSAVAKVCPPGPERFNAISAVFPGASIDESHFIDQAVGQTGVASTRITLTPETVFSDAEAIVRAQDEPYGSTSIHAQYHVFRKAREIGVKVMLDGQGADEILGGYHGCFHYHYASLIRRMRLGELLQTLSQRKAWHGLGYRQQLAPFAAMLPGPMHHLLLPADRPAPPDAVWMNSEQLAPYRPSQGSVLRQALEAEGLGPSRSLGDYCVVLTRSTSLPMLLRYEDRNSMAHGIEARVPFLDHRLVEFVLRLGDQHKIVGGDTKRVLRRAMENILPESIRLRRDKLGFATPEEMWFKGPLRKAVEAGIEETLALYPDLLVRDATREFARQMLDGQRPFDFSLWRIVVFGIWGRTFGMSL